MPGRLHEHCDGADGGVRGRAAAEEVRRVLHPGEQWCEPPPPAPASRPAPAPGSADVCLRRAGRGAPSRCIAAGHAWLVSDCSACSRSRLSTPEQRSVPSRAGESPHGPLASRPAPAVVAPPPQCCTSAPRSSDGQPRVALLIHRPVGRVHLCHRPCLLPRLQTPSDILSGTQVPASHQPRRARPPSRLSWRAAIGRVVAAL